MPPPIDIAGHRFGRLVALKACGKRGGRVLWECQCDCGAQHQALARELRSGTIRSCGCLRTDAVIASVLSRSRDLASHPLYAIWRGMIKRCRGTSFPDYGGRGIRVCERWQNDFAAFAQDMGERPPGASIDRIDNNGNYEPGNCRWATRTQQNRNARRNRLLTLGGKTQCVTAWADELGIKLRTLRWRIDQGWSDERVLTKPVEHRP